MTFAIVCFVVSAAACAALLPSLRPASVRPVSRSAPRTSAVPLPAPVPMPDLYTGRHRAVVLIGVAR